MTSTRTRLVLAIAALAVLAAVGLALWYVYLSRPRTPDWTRATRVQLTDQPGTEYFPTLAPDGKNFVYASRVGGNWDLFLQRVGGRNATPLTPDTPSDESQPAFSPSGDRIAFRSNREPAGIYVMEATGENVRLVVAEGHHPSWSPEGTEIVYSTSGRDMPTTRTTVPSALWVVSLETGAKRLLTQTDAIQPSWSPHGHRVAYWFMPPNVGRSDIATVPSGGGDAVVVTRDAATNWNPVWSPDGKFLYFASDRRGNMSFWRVEIDEETGEVRGEPEAVGTPSTFNRHLSFSRDGKRLLYVQTSQQSNIKAVGFNPKTEKVSGEPVWVTRGDRQISRPRTLAGRQTVRHALAATLAGRPRASSTATARTGATLRTTSSSTATRAGRPTAEHSVRVRPEAATTRSGRSTRTARTCANSPSTASAARRFPSGRPTASGYSSGVTS